jgi:hypothetical protein
LGAHGLFFFDSSVIGARLSAGCRVAREWKHECPVLILVRNHPAPGAGFDAAVIELIDG